MAITLRDAPIGGIRLTDTVQPYNSEAFEADNTRGGLINEAIRGWNASGIGSASSALEEQALKAGIEGRRADQAYLQQQAQGLRQRAQMWAPTVSEATDINSLSSGVDWLGGAVGNLRSSVAPAVGGLAGAVAGTALAPFTGGVINPLTGAMLGAGMVGYNTMTDEAIGNAATDKVVQDRLRRGEITEQDILNTSRLSGLAQAPLEALVPAGLGGALAGGVKKEIGKRAAAYIGGQMLKEGGEEALTEGAQSLVSQTGQNYLRGDDLTNYDWKDVANSAAAGFAPGAVMGGTGGAATAAWNKTAEPNADGKNVWERAGDYIADRGASAGKRQAEKEGEALRARLDAMEKQLTSTPRLDPTMTEADAAATVMQDDQLKRTAAQELSTAVLNDPDASPAKREIMERYVRSSEAGATNAHEALGAELGMYGLAQEKVLGVLTDLLGKVGIEPAPDNRGKANAMRPEPQPYTDDELYRHSRLYDLSPDLRTLPLSQLAKVDKAIERFAQGEFGPEVRATLDQMFGAPEITEQVLSLYREGKSEGVQDFGSSATQADRSNIDGDENTFSQKITENDEGYGSGVTELGTDSKVSYATGSYLRPSEAAAKQADKNYKARSYFDTKDAEQAARLEKTVEAMGEKGTSSAEVSASKMGMVDAEVERQLGEDASDGDRERLELQITNEYFPKMDAVEERPSYFDKMDTFAQREHVKRYKSYRRELAKRVRAVNKRFVTVKAVSREVERPGLDFTHDDVKSLAVDYGKEGVNNPKASPTAGTIVLERSDSKTPFMTTIPNVLRRVYQIGTARETTQEEVSSLEDMYNLLRTGLTSLVDYSKRSEDAAKDYAERSIRGEVSIDEQAPERAKVNFTGRFGYVERGQVKWVNDLRDLPDNLLLTNKGKRLTVGDLKNLKAEQSAVEAVSATRVREALEKRMKGGGFNNLDKEERARISATITAHKKNPENAVAAGALKALYRKHVGGVFNDPTENNVERDDIVPSESTTTTDENGSPLELGLRAYDDPNKPIHRNADGTTSSNPGYNVTGPAQSKGATVGSVGEDNMSPATKVVNQELREEKFKPISQSLIDALEKVGNLKLRVPAVEEIKAISDLFARLSEKLSARKVDIDSAINRMAVIKGDGPMGRMSTRGELKILSLNEKVFSGKGLLDQLNETREQRIERVVSHELGHAIDQGSVYSNKGTFKPGGKLYEAAMSSRSISAYHEQMFGYIEGHARANREMFAQLFSMYLTNNEVMRETLPEAHKSFGNVFGTGGNTSRAGQDLVQVGQRDGRPVSAGRREEGVRSGQAEQAESGLNITESKPNAQSAQTPKQDKSATQAELDAVVAEISTMVGSDTTVKIFKEINGGQWSGEWTKENGQALIKIALGAHDKLGVGYHEAMHQLFSLLSEHGGESVKRLLGNVATNQLIMRQLKLKLAEEKAALDQLSDPEEAASYTFQFWRVDGLKVGPQLDTLFKKLVNALDNLQLAVREKLFGSNKAAVRRSEKAQAALAERVMQLYKNGAFADPSLRNDVIAALEKDAKAAMNKRAQVTALGKTFTGFAKRWVYTAADAFESSGNPVLEALGKRLFHLEGDKTSHQSYLERHAMMADRYSNRVRDIFVGLNEDEVKQLGKYLNERRDPSTVAHPELRARMEQIVGRKQPDGTYKDGLLPEMRLYMMNSGAKRWEPGKDGAPGEWVDMGEVRELYWPRMWDTDKLMANVDEFLTELTADIEAYRAKGGYPEASENYPSREIAKNILNSLVNGQGANDIEETETDFDTLGVQPFMSSINRRELNWIDDKKYAKYFSDDPVFALTNYVAQSTKRAEFVRQFGNGGEELATEVQRALVWEMGGESILEGAERALHDAKREWAKKYAQAVAAGVPKDERPGKPTILSEARKILDDRIRQDAYEENVAELKKLDINALEKALDKLTAGKVEDLQKKAAETIKPAVEAIQAIEGTLGHDIDPRWRMVGSAVTTYQNFRLLVPALFSNINDIAGIVARGGEVSDAFNALVRAAREIRLRWKDDYSKDELSQLAENIGVVGAGSFMNGMGQAYSSQFMYGKLRRANDALFKWNGLEAMNRAVRIEATGVAIRSIESNLKNPNKAHSQRHLEEVYGEGFDRENLLDAQGRLDMNNERNREAVMRWVNGAIIRPNASLRPSKASDPNYVLFYHLKQFAYAFQKVHLRRAYLEAKEGNYTPAMSLAAVYMPITIAADVVRETLLPDDDPPWMKQGMGAYLKHGVARANFGGVPQMYLEGVTDPAMIFGPLVNQVQDMASVPLFEDKELDRELLGALPGGTLARRLDRD